MTDPVLLGISGSLRREAANRKLIREAARLFGPARFSEADLRLPLFDEDAETTQGIPEAVRLLAEQIAQADAVVISTPEYNKAPSGVLKNALDWVSRVKGRPWRDKPVAVMSAASGRAGGERAQVILRMMLVPFQPRVIPGPEFHLASCDDAFDAEGRLIGERPQKSLGVLMQRLRDEIGR